MLQTAILRFMKTVMQKGDDKRLATQVPTAGVTCVADIAYLNDGDPMHLLDIYYPDGTATALPVILDIHGGGLFYGDKALNRNYGRYLASHGYVVVMPSYRLVPQVYMQQQLQDVMAVYRWMEANAAQHFGDLSNVFVTGDSAGAFLAVYSSLANVSQDLQRVFAVQGTGIHVRALGLVSGMFELKAGVINLIKGAFFEEGYKTSELYGYMDFASIPDLDKLPPCFLATSRQDFIGSATRKTAQLLHARGHDYQLCDWPKGEKNPLAHVFSITYPYEYEESVATTGKMLTFFANHSKK